MQLYYGCTYIRTSNVLLDSIKNIYDTIVLWTAINRTHNVNVPRKMSQKNADINIEDSVRYRAEWVGKLFQLANFCKNVQDKTVGGGIPSMKIFEKCGYKLDQHDCR